MAGAKVYKLEYYTYYGSMDAAGHSASFNLHRPLGHSSTS